MGWTTIPRPPAELPYGGSDIVNKDNEVLFLELSKLAICFIHRVEKREQSFFSNITRVYSSKNHIPGSIHAIICNRKASIVFEQI